MSKLTQNTGACSEKVEEGEEPNPDKVCWGGGGRGGGGLGPVPELRAFPLSLMILGRHTKKHSALPKEYHEPFIHGPPYEKPYIPS